jgi:glutaredoxin
LSDFYPHGKLAQMFGVLRSEGYSERAIFVIDRKGIVRYVDVHDIEQQPDNEELFRILSGLNPPNQARGAVAPSLMAAQSSTPGRGEGLVLYCTPWCPSCNRARAYLKERNIPFVEIDISRDRAAAQRVRGWARGSETTPTFDIQGTIVVNFDKEKLDKALGLV